MMHRRLPVSVLIVVMAVLVLMPVTAAQDIRSGGNVAVPADATAQDLTVTGGTVTIDGTVEDGLTVIGGSVAINGNVSGDVVVVGGSIRVDGTVDGRLNAYGGTVELAENGSVTGTMEAGADEVIIDGRVGQDARIDADRLEIGPTAAIGGNVIHDTATFALAEDASIAGEIRSVDNVNVARGLPLQGDIPIWGFALYGFLVNLLLGAVLLFLLPGYSHDVAVVGRRRPLVSMVIGLLTLLLAPVVLALLAVTVIGIPVAIIGLFVYLFALWAAMVYGGLAIGSALIGRRGAVNKWLALIVGLAVVFILGMIPYIGGVILFLVLILGLGAIVSAAW